MSFIRPIEMTVCSLSYPDQYSRQIAIAIKSGGHIPGPPQPDGCQAPFPEHEMNRKAIVVPERGLLWWLSCNMGDLGSIPGSGRSPGERNGNPFLYSCLENSMDCGRLQSIRSQRVGHDRFEVFPVKD